MRPYKAVIFDLDGTLIDNTASFYWAYERFSEIYPNVIDPSNVRQRRELISIYNAPDRKAAYEAFCSAWNWKNPPAFSVFWKEWFTLYTDSTVPFAWTKQTLERLRACGIRMALITNGNAEYQRAKLQSSGLLPYFEVVLISGEIGIAKPNAEIYLQCLKRLELSASECLYVGDTPETDIAGAVAAGLDSMLIGDRPDTVGATAIGKTIKELPIFQ